MALYGTAQPYVVVYILFICYILYILQLQKMCLEQSIVCFYADANNHKSGYSHNVTQ